MLRTIAYAALLAFGSVGCAAETAEDTGETTSGISNALNAVTLTTKQQCEGGLMREVVTIRIKNTAKTRISIGVEGEGFVRSEDVAAPLRIGETRSVTFYGDRGVDLESVTVTSTEPIRAPAITSTRCSM
jgi:hypothetical protein